MQDICGKKQLNYHLYYREYYWANYTTGLGASLHELGHTFDLAHTPSGIMARGFDDLNKVFIVQRSKGSLLGDQYGGNRRSLSESSSLTGDITEEAGQRGSMQVKVIEPNNRRYKDICFGSPYRKVPLETGYINCKLADAFFISISFLDVHLL